MQRNTRKGPGVAAPKPLCIAYLANALFPYAYNVVEGNQIRVQSAFKRKRGLQAEWELDLTDQPTMQAEAPENAL